MKLRYRILNGILAVVVVAIGALALTLSHSTDCGPLPELAENTESMKAVISRCYGSPDALEFADIEKPVPAADEVLVKIRAAAVNPLDYHYMRGSPYLMRLGSGIGAPDNWSMGVDFAGIVEAVGASVTAFEPGDEVFGGRSGAFGEYVAVPQDRAIVKKPAGISFEQAAAIPIAAITALQALRDKGNLQPGQKVLINGASGGVGTYAVQIARSFGAEVHGVCSTRNVEMVKSLGADHVYDYKKESYTDSGQQFDVIVDMVGNHSMSANRNVMTPNGNYVLVGGPKGNWIAPLLRPLQAMLYDPFVDQSYQMLLAELKQDDLQTLADLMATGKLTSVIDRHYSLADVPEAIRYSESGRARGKIIIDVN